MAHTLIGPGATWHLAHSARLAAVLSALVVGLCSAPCAAQSFALPVDVEQGLVIGAARPRTPYLFAARVTPSLDLERARLGLVLGPAYRNPRWDLSVGGRLSWFVPAGVRDLGVRFVVQGEYLPNTRASRASIGVLGELFGLLRLGVWPAYDFQAMRAELCVSIGWGVMSWERLARMAQ